MMLIQNKSFYKHVYLSFAFFTFLFFLIVYLINNSKINNGNFLVIFSFFLNGILFLFGLLHKNKIGYSLKDVVNIFLFIFMFLTPFIQYLNGVYPWWSTYLLSDSLIVITNIYVLLFYLIFLTSYKLRSDGIIFLKTSNTFTPIKSITNTLNILFILTLFSTIFIIQNIGLLNLFSRSTYNLNLSSQSLVLIVSNTFRSISVFYVAFNILYFKKNKKFYKLFPFIIGSVLMLLVNFPLSTARFWTATIFIGYLIIYLRKIDNSYFFRAILFFGLFLIFPILNIFRQFSFQNGDNFEVYVPNLIYDFLQGDFDSFSMLTRAIYHIQNYGISYGRQLLGNFFFFVPRSLWLNKPIGTGAFIANFLGWEFNNVSMPFIGEGIINFGFLGMVFFAFILGKVLAKFDLLYTKIVQKNYSSYSYLEIIFPFSLGFLFFILRGDLLSSLSFFLGFMLPIWILIFLEKLAYTKSFKLK